jgi:FkbM family methyltransferase
VQKLHLHDLANWWLGHFPWTKRLPGSGVVYRATRVESIPLAVEMLEKKTLYDLSLLPADFTTFVDLGCNVGYFTCCLAHLAKGRKLQGLMIDANEAAVREAIWHAQANGLSEVIGLHGIVGEKGEQGSADFYLYESNICSMSQPSDLASTALMGTWTKVAVPCLRVEENWSRHFGDRRCNLLKVDIEGSELNFLESEPVFLRRVDSILLEWHKWRVNLNQVKKHLESRGFVLDRILDENESMGTCLFKHANST